VYQQSNRSQQLRVLSFVCFRYPIFPVHQEGSAYYKEFSALKDVVRVGAKYAHLYDQPLGGLSTDTPAGSEVWRYRTRYLGYLMCLLRPCF